MKRALTAFLVLVASVVPCAAQDAAALRFSKGIETPRLKQEEIVAATLDPEVYSAAANDFADLRVLDSSGARVPYVIDKVMTGSSTSVRTTAPARDLSLRELPGGGLEIEAARDPKLPPIEGISLITPLTNYQQRVQVQGSSDGKKWEPLVADALIFDYSRYLDVRNHDIALPANRSSRFRIQIRDVTAQQESELLELTRKLREGKETERTERLSIERRPFRIDRIGFWYHVSQENRKEDRKTEYPVVDFHVEQSQDKRQTLIEVQTRREPLTGLILQSASRNFSRSAAVQIPLTRGIRTDWREIGSATIAQIDFRDLHRQELTIHFPEQRAETYRIVIDDGDSSPLKISAVGGYGNIYRVVFLASPDGGYRLDYGSEAASAPSYDVAAIREALGRRYEPASVRLGDQVERPITAAPPVSRVRGWLNNPVLLGVVIGVLVIVLAWALYRAARRMDQASGSSAPGQPG
jgi:hypothetical protein